MRNLLCYPLTVCIALYTVAKLPRPISSILVKLPMACESFEDLREVVDVDPGAAISGAGSPGPWSRIWYTSFCYRLNCRSRAEVRWSDMDTSASRDGKKRATRVFVAVDAVEWATLRSRWRDGRL
jgi:hypothetical protein